MDVLHNIELQLAQVYRTHSAMLDYDARAAIEALIREYQAAARNRTLPAVKLNPLAQSAYDGVKLMCEFHLGRAPLPLEDEKGQSAEFTPPDAKTVDEILACLKRIRKSIDFWTKDRGRQGYLNYVTQFV